ncbi:TPA: alpha-keto acid decarboxylase family protein, partial [Salmonella enterica subsp. enterica serovar Poona]
YNDIAGWNYSLLPEALGCKDWLVQRVATCGQLNETIARIEETASAAYIEVLTGRYDAAGLTRRLHASVMEK